MEQKKDEGLSSYIRLFLKRRFNLHLDKANEEEVVASIRSNTVFVGCYSWSILKYNFCVAFNSILKKGRRNPAHRPIIIN
jgi:hypothetical protein